MSCLGGRQALSACGGKCADGEGGGSSSGSGEATVEAETGAAETGSSQASTHHPRLWHRVVIVEIWWLSLQTIEGMKECSMVVW